MCKRYPSTSIADTQCDGTQLLEVVVTARKFILLIIRAIFLCMAFQNLSAVAALQNPYVVEVNTPQVFGDSVEIDGRFGLQNYQTSYVNGYARILFTVSHHACCYPAYPPAILATKQDPRSGYQLADIIFRGAFTNVNAAGTPTDWYSVEIQFNSSGFVVRAWSSNGTLYSQQTTLLADLPSHSWIALHNEWPVWGCSTGIVDCIYSMAFTPIQLKEDAPVFDLALLDFGGQAFGSSSGARAASLTNVGTSTIYLGDIGLAGNHTSDFVVDRSTCTRIALNPGTACSIAIRFTPKDLGPRSAKLSLENVSSGRALALSLDGVGTSAPATPMPRVSTATPSSGTVDTIVTLSGVNFGAANIGGVVKFTTPSASRVASIVSWTDRTVKVRAPNLSGPAQITLSNAGGSSIGRAFAYESNGYCPIGIRTDHLPLVRSTRQDFTRGFILRTPSTIPLEDALSAWAGTEVANWNSSGAADTCFIAALDAMRQARWSSFARLGFRQLTNVFVNASLGLIPAANPFEEFVVRFVKATISPIILEKSLLNSYIYAFAEEAAGLIISKEVNNHLVKGAAASLVSLGLDETSSFLKDQGSLEWIWAGDNSSSPYVRAGLGVASINSASFYDPWNRYTTTLVSASCIPAAGGTAVNKKYLIYFENEKTVSNTFDYASVKAKTVVWKELPQRNTSCRK